MKTQGDPLAPARGVVFGTVFGVGLWAVIFALFYAAAWALGLL